MATFFVAVLGLQLLLPADNSTVEAQGNILNAPGVKYEEEEKKKENKQEEKKQEKKNPEAKQADKKDLRANKEQDKEKKDDKKQPAAKKEDSDKEAKKDSEEAKDSADSKVSYPNKAYIYRAQAGDSYSQMVRKAIQTYGINNDIKLSQAEILMAETNLTLLAGSPYLHLGQEVAIEVGAVANWMEKAQDMSAAEEAAWAHYVPGVEFNTDRVGEAT